MTKEITKKQMCAVMRNGVELWIDEEKAEELGSVLAGIREHKFIRHPNGKEWMNTADLTGVFLAETMEESTRRKNGQWKCRWNFWHDRGIKCECIRNQKVKCLSCGTEKSDAWVEVAGGRKCQICYLK